MESIFEEDSQLRRCVEHELVSNPALTPDQALKVHFSPSPSSVLNHAYAPDLNLYHFWQNRRWTHGEIL